MPVLILNGVSRYEQARELLINRKIQLQKIIANAAAQAAATPPTKSKSIKKNKIVHVSYIYTLYKQ